MATHLTNLTIVHHDDTVCVFNGGESVSHRKARTTLHQRFQRHLDMVFTFTIQSTRGFVQDEDLSVLQQGSCNGNALLLTARQQSPGFTDGRFQTLRQRFNKRLQCRSFHRLHDGFFRHVF